MSTCESTLDELAAWGSQTTEPAADTFQRYEMDETRRAPLKVSLDISSAPAAPPQRLEQPSRLQTLPLADVASSCRPASASSAQQGEAQAGRERGHAKSRQGALAIVKTLHDTRGCGYRRR